MSIPYVSNLSFEIVGATYKAVRVMAYGRTEWFPKSCVSVSNGRVVAAADWIFRQKFPSKVNNPESLPIPAPYVRKTINPDLTLGAYQLGDDVFVVRMTRKKTKFGREIPRTLYALQMCAINSERLMLDDTTQRVDFRYTNAAKAAIYELTPEAKLPMVTQESITIRYGRCLICARGLKVAESVKRGIGPICYGKMANKFVPVSDATRQELVQAKQTDEQKIYQAWETSDES